MARGRFITLEGLDGAGKSTHLVWLAERLRATGRTLVQTREPGGTPLGEKLRALLLSDAMHLETEALLMFAARREHLAQVIEPALARGDWVLCDRFTDASFAYQGGGRGLATDRLTLLEQWVQGALQPDLTIFLDLPAGRARQRVVDMNRDLDRFEREQQAFFERVRDAYLERARLSGGRIRVVNADRSIPAIQTELEEIIGTL